MKNTIAGILSLLFMGFTNAQNKPILSVNIEIVGKGDFYNSPSCRDRCYLTRFEIINNEDSTLPVAIWNCSWYDNWKTNNDSIRIMPWGCDHNFPEIRKIPSKKSLILYAGILVRPGTFSRSFKMGFGNVFPKFEDINSLDYDREPKGKIFWSDEVQLDDENKYFFYPILK